MIYTRLKDEVEAPGQRPFIVDSDEVESWEEVEQDVWELAAGLRHQEVNRLYLKGLDDRTGVKALLASDLAGIEVSVLDENYSDEQVCDTMQRVGEGKLLRDADELRAFREAGVRAQSDTSFDEPGRGKIVVMTTGTTGRPKAVRYEWKTLLQQVRETENAGERWLLVYPLNHFAAVQVCLHVLVNAGTLVIPSAREHRPVYEAMRTHEVTSVSATPTFWRMFAGRLSQEEAEQLSLQHITLGGEAVTGDILQRLDDLFPDATITHVYATTEIGSCFSVQDGHPGFPVDFLDRPVGNVELKIKEGELYVRSPNRMEEYAGGADLTEDDGWIATGDLVEVKEDRVLFRGRKTESINVGGVKVYPLKVEETVLQISGVQSARAYGKSNPVTGEVVVLDVEPEPSADRESLKEEVRTACQQKLNRYERPRRVNIVDHLQRSNEKIVRT